MWVRLARKNVKTKNTEHKRAVRNVDRNNGLAVHAAETEHEIRWDEAEVICREEQWTKRKIKEGLQIKAHTGNLKLDTGAFIDTNWNPPLLVHFIFSPLVIILLISSSHPLYCFTQSSSTSNFNNFTPIPSPFYTPVSHLVSI